MSYLPLTSEPVQIWPEVQNPAIKTREKRTQPSTLHVLKNIFYSLYDIQIFKLTFLFLGSVLIFISTYSIIGIFTPQQKTMSENRISSPFGEIVKTMVFSHFSITVGSSIRSPIRIQIPSIRLDASVKPISLTDKGSLDVPSNAMEVGWYKLGAKPGQKGTAIIDGHIDAQDGSPGVFSKLFLLKQGDSIIVTDDMGKTINFVVKDVRSYPEETNAPDVFNQNDNGIHLNLITCAGSWDLIKKTYTNRLVVFSDAIN